MIILKKINSSVVGAAVLVDGDGNSLTTTSGVLGSILNVREQNLDTEGYIRNSSHNMGKYNGTWTPFAVDDLGRQRMIIETVPGVHTISGTEHIGQLSDSQIPDFITRDTELSSAVSTLQSGIDNHTHTESDITDLDKYTQAEVDAKFVATSGTLQNQLNNLDVTYISEIEFTAYYNSLTSAIGNKADTTHTHDDRYYTESEIDALLSTTSGSLQTQITELNLDYVTESEFTIYSGILQDQIDNKASSIHYHDNRYYTESEIDTTLSGKSDTNHQHTESDITDLDKYTQSEVDSLISTASGSLQTQITSLNLDYVTEVEFSTYSGTLQSQIDSKSDTSHTHIESDVTNLDKYTQAEVDALLSTVSGAINTQIINLDLDYITEVELTSYSGVIQNQIDGKADASHIHDDRYYTESEVDALILSVSGTGGAGSSTFLELTDTPTTYSGSTGLFAKSTGSGIAWSTSEYDHNHDDRYYTKEEILTISGVIDAEKADVNHIHDDRYYTETELDGGQLDNRYYTETETDNMLDFYQLIDGTPTTVNYDFSQPAGSYVLPTGWSQTGDYWDFFLDQDNNRLFMDMGWFTEELPILTYDTTRVISGDFIIEVHIDSTLYSDEHFKYAGIGVFSNPTASFESGTYAVLGYCTDSDIDWEWHLLFKTSVGQTIGAVETNYDYDFRLTRIGSTVTGYYYKNSSWVQIGSANIGTADVYLGVAGDNVSTGFVGTLQLMLSNLQLQYNWTDPEVKVNKKITMIKDVHGNKPTKNSAPTVLTTKEYVDDTVTSGTLQSFSDIPDVPTTYLGSEGKYLRVTASGIEYAVVPSYDTFISLADTPATYSGSEGKYLIVTSSGIEYAEISTTASFLDLTDTPSSYSNGLYAKSTTSGLEWYDIDVDYVSHAEFATYSGSIETQLDFYNTIDPGGGEDPYIKINKKVVLIKEAHGKKPTATSSGTQLTTKDYVDDTVISGAVYSMPISSDHGYKGDVFYSTANQSLSFGDLCYLKSDGGFTHTSASSESTAKGFLTLSLGTTASGGVGVFMIKGMVRDDSWSWTPGQELWMSTVAGDITGTAASGTGEIVRLIGYALNTDYIWFDPDKVYIEVA